MNQRGMNKNLTYSYIANRRPLFVRNACVSMHLTHFLYAPLSESVTSPFFLSINDEVYSVTIVLYEQVLDHHLLIRLTDKTGLVAKLVVCVLKP